MKKILTLLACLVYISVHAAVQIPLTWDPGDPGDMITGYRLYTAPVNSTTWTLVATVTTNRYLLTLTQSAQVTVRAVNDVGESGNSNIKAFAAKVPEIIATLTNSVIIIIP